MSDTPNLIFSHLGISVRDLPKMVNFYEEVLGYTVTDKGSVAGLDVVFMSRDPEDHHQIALATGRPASLPENELNSAFGPSINQISFRMGTLSDLRSLRERLNRHGVIDSQMIFGNHGISWSIYAPDPEGNILEFFVDSEWYIAQPQLEPIDFSKSDAEIYEETRARCLGDPSYMPAEEWRQNISPRMTRFRPSASPLG